MKRYWPLIYMSFIGMILEAQAPHDFDSPLDIPLVLSGNFGELRSDHFHSGIDIKTQGSIGKSVYAIESGYVSRIKIQAGGYGKALYLSHPNGYTSVYGHLEDYSEEIEAFVKKHQYEDRSFEQDIYLKPGVLRIEKGSVIAFSGNTGSSAGPHLHFEIRRSRDQVPQNVLFYGFPVKDTRAPIPYHITVMPLNDHSFVDSGQEDKILTLEKKDGVYSPKSTKVTRVYGEIGFGVEVYDYLNGASNKCGVYSIELLIDGTRYFYSELNEFAFHHSRFINAHIDYGLKQEKGIKIQKLYREPYNDLEIYKELLNEGKYKVSDTLDHSISLRIKDSYGNASHVEMTIKGTNKALAPKVQTAGKSTQMLPYSLPSVFRRNGIELKFPAYSFYKDEAFNYKRFKGGASLLSDIYEIGDISIPLQKSFELIIEREIERVPENSVCLVKLNSKGDISYSGGAYSSGKLKHTLRSFGKYALSADTIAPSVVPHNFVPNGYIGNKSRIILLVDDDFSGVKNYEGLIDGKWVLFEYDRKTGQIFYDFDENITKSGKIHELEVHLSDMIGNKSTYRTEFIY